MALLIELKQNILKFVWRHKISQIAKAILTKKNGAGRKGPLSSDHTTKLYYPNNMVWAQKQRRIKGRGQKAQK